MQICSYEAGVFLFPVDLSVEVRVVFDFLLEAARDPKVHALVEAIWEEGCTKHGKALFNGKIAHLISYSPQQISIAFVEYKLFFAWNNDERLHRVLSIHPIGISGVTRYRNCILQGRRSEQLASRPGLVELAPSGGIDPQSIDTRGQIDIYELATRELYEETGISSQSVSSITPRMLAWTVSDGIWDIVLEIVLDDTKEISLPTYTAEYQELCWREKETIEQQGMKAEGEVVPLSLRLSRSIQ